MVNALWLLLLAGGVLCAAVTGRIDSVTAGAIAAAEAAVALAFKLIGVMALWLGMMRIADQAGLVRLATHLIRPVARFLFPSVPLRHPAMGAIMMTISANMLGLGNAATPLGIKAMQELAKLNPRPGTASDAMCTLLALCTTGFTLVPATVIALRAAAGSQNPTEIVGPTIMVSFLATVVVVVADRLCRGFWHRRCGR